MAAAFPYPQTTLAPLDEPIQAADSASAEEKRAEAYVELFRDPARAAGLAADALEAARFASATTVEAHAALTLCLARLLNPEDDADIGCVEHLESLVTRSIDPRAHWLLYDARALALFRQGRSEDALVELIRLMVSSTDNRPARDCFLTIASLARIHGALGNIAEGLGSAYRALSLARRTGSISLRVYALILLGERQLDLHHLETARMAFEQALRGSQRANSLYLNQLALIGLTETCVAGGESQVAVDLVLQADAADRLTPELAEAVALAHVANGDMGEALKWVDVAAASGDSLRQTWIRARIDLADGQPDAAERRCAEAIARFLSDRPSRDELALWATRADIAAARGDASLAASCRDEVDRLRGALDERAALARSLSADFESTILQAHPMCCEMTGEQPACS